MRDALLQTVAAEWSWLPGGQVVVLILLLQGYRSRCKDPVVCVLGIDIATLLSRRRPASFCPPLCPDVLLSLSFFSLHTTPRSYANTSALLDALGVTECP